MRREPANDFTLRGIRMFVPMALSLVLLSTFLAACVTTGIVSGGNWQSSGLQHQHIRALAVDPNNPQKLYAGDLQGSVFVSTNAAQSWSELGAGLLLPNSIHELAFDDSGKKLYAATDRGIFVSADEAQNWSLVSTHDSGLPVESYTSLAFDLNSPKTLYTGTSTRGVFVSTNEGVSWTAINYGLPQNLMINALAYDTDQHQLWAATSVGVYRSDDKGISWHAFNRGLPANVVAYTVQSASASGGTKGLVYVGTNRGFFLSQNSGIQWAVGQEALSGTSIRRILVDFRTTDATTVFVATDLGAFRSDDRGQTWGGIATGLPKNVPVYALALGASDYTQLYAATDDVYLYPGSSGGLSFTRILSLLAVVLFFYLLYRLTRRRRGERRSWFKPERIDAPSASKVES